MNIYNKNDGQNVKDASTGESKFIKMQNDEDFVDEKEMKGAIHIGVLKASDDIVIKVGDRNGAEMTFGEEVISKVAAFVWDTVCNSWIDDLTIFAGHGNRQKIQLEDISVMTRRSPELFQHASFLSDPFPSLKTPLNKFERRRKLKVNKCQEQTSFEYFSNPTTAHKFTSPLRSKETKQFSQQLSSTPKKNDRIPGIFHDHITPIQALYSKSKSHNQGIVEKKTTNNFESDSFRASGREFRGDNLDSTLSDLNRTESGGYFGGKMDISAEYRKDGNTKHDISTELFGFGASNSEEAFTDARNKLENINSVPSLNLDSRERKKCVHRPAYNPTDETSTKKKTRKLNLLPNSFDEFDFDI